MTSGEAERAQVAEELPPLSPPARLLECAEMMDRLFDYARISPRCSTIEGPAHKTIIYAFMLSAIDEAACALRHAARAHLAQEAGKR